MDYFSISKMREKVVICYRTLLLLCYRTTLGRSETGQPGNAVQIVDNSCGIDGVGNRIRCALYQAHIPSSHCVPGQMNFNIPYIFPLYCNEILKFFLSLFWLVFFMIISRTFLMILKQTSGNACAVHNHAFFLQI